MKKNKRNRLWTIVFVFLGVLVLGIGIWFSIGIFVFMNPSCGVEEVEKIVYENLGIIHEIVNCGATTDYSTIIRINDESLFVVKGKYDLDELTLQLKGNQLIISCDECLDEKVFQQLKEYKDIKIIYKIGTNKKK